MVQISTVLWAIPCCLLKVLLKQEFLDIYFTTYFGVRNFGNTSAMRVILFWNRSKFNIDLKYEETSSENGFCFWVICILIGCIKLSLLRREYLSLAVNVLTNNPQNLHITKRYFFQLSFLHSDQKIWQRWFGSDFKNVSTPYMLLVEGPVKLEFFDIYSTTFFGVRNFGNTSAMRVIFLLKNFKM